MAIKLLRVIGSNVQKNTKPQYWKNDKDDDIEEE